MRKEFIYPVRICKIEGIENSEALLSKNEYFVKRNQQHLFVKGGIFNNAVWNVLLNSAANN